MVVEHPKLITMVNNVKKHHSLSYEIIGIDMRPFLVFSETRGSQNRAWLRSKLAKTVIGGSSGFFNWFMWILFMTAISGHHKFSFETTYPTYANKGRGSYSKISFTARHNSAFCWILSNFTLYDCTKFNKIYIFLVIF